MSNLVASSNKLISECHFFWATFSIFLISQLAWVSFLVDIWSHLKFTHVKFIIKCENVLQSLTTYFSFTFIYLFIYFSAVKR